MEAGGGKRVRPGRVLTAVLLVLVGVLVFTQTSSASKLTLIGPTPPVATAVSRCAGNTLTISIDATAVSVSGISTACSGRTLTVLVRSGGITQTASVVLRGQTASLTLGPAVTAADGVTATIGTWSVPVTWSVAPALPAFSCTIPAAPSVPCTVRVTSREAWGTPPSRVWQYNIQISTTSAQPVAWRLTINLSDPSFPFLTRRLHDTTNGGLVNVVAASCSATPRTVSATGNVGWGYSQISASSPLTTQVRGDETGSGGNLLNC